MKQIFYIPASLLMLLFVSCAGQGAKKVEAATEPKSQPSFMMPRVPNHIVDPQDKVNYLLDHFWDDYNFADTLLLQDRKVTGEAFAAFAQVLSYASPSDTKRGVETLLSSAFKVDSAAFALFAKLFEDYFYNANSPYLNEELYIPALEYIVENDSIDAINKIRSEFQLKMALKNRVGQQATDFDYTLLSGARAKMHNIKADYTILYFNNPDCHDCKRVKGYIESSQLLAELHAKGALKILSIYPDADLEIWKGTQYPAMMINSYDAEQKITTEQLYDLKAIPSLYLLDSEKRVLLKDAPIEQIEMALGQLPMFGTASGGRR